MTYMIAMYFQIKSIVRVKCFLGFALKLCQSVHLRIQNSPLTHRIAITPGKQQRQNHKKQYTADMHNYIKYNCHSVRTCHHT